MKNYRLHKLMYNTKNNYNKTGRNLLYYIFRLECQRHLGQQQMREQQMLVTHVEPGFINILEYRIKFMCARILNLVILF